MQGLRQRLVFWQARPMDERWQSNAQRRQGNDVLHWMCSSRFDSGPESG